MGDDSFPSLAGPNPPAPGAVDDLQRNIEPGGWRRMGVVGERGTGCGVGVYARPSDPVLRSAPRAHQAGHCLVASGYTVKSLARSRSASFSPPLAIPSGVSSCAHDGPTMREMIGRRLNNRYCLLVQTAG